MPSITPATTPKPEDEITLSWLLENPITRPRMICSLAGIIADFNDLNPDAPETADPDTRDLWFLTNQAWRSIHRDEIDQAFRSLRERTETRRTRRDRQIGGKARAPMTGS